MKIKSLFAAVNQKFAAVNQILAAENQNRAAENQTGPLEKPHFGGHPPCCVSLHEINENHQKSMEIIENL